MPRCVGQKRAKVSENPTDHARAGSSHRACMILNAIHPCFANGSGSGAESVTRWPNRWTRHGLGLGLGLGLGNDHATIQRIGFMPWVF